KFQRSEDFMGFRLWALLAFQFIWIKALTDGRWENVGTLRKILSGTQAVISRIFYGTYFYNQIMIDLCTFFAKKTFILRTQILHSHAKKNNRTAPATVALSCDLCDD
ncbi:hypothetical protein ACJX0J_034964, partial [Zea mays]